MKAQAFRHTPVAIAISSALLFGCSADRSQQTTEVEPVPAHPQQLIVDSSHNNKKGLEKRERDGTALAKLRSLSDSITTTEEAPAQVKSTGRVLQEIKKSNMPARGSADMASSYIAPVPTTAPALGYAEPPADNERYAAFTDNPVKSTAVDPMSTFGVDVDTASYALSRQTLNHGLLPRPDSVRTEEWLNYFTYDYPSPAGLDQPFSVYTEIAPAPWNTDKHLLAIGLKGYDVAKADLPPLNLTFLIDVSGSMSSPNKLGLAKNALKMLTQQLRPHDRVAIAVYAGAAGLVLESTPGNQKQTIISALDRLRAGGSTAGGAGIQLAYKTARANHQDDSISRVILLSDGDFNVGTTNTESLKKLIEKERDSGVSLSVLTFGRGNIRDELMNSLAEIGNGNAGYIDTAQEAQKYLVDEMAGSMMTIAKDVKAQIEFNPTVVSEYRLLGYETRHLEHHEFNDDTKDAGEIGAGHEVTALYEVIMQDSPARLTPEHRYQPAGTDEQDRLSRHSRASEELAFLKLRYKQPQGSTSTLMTYPIYSKEIIKNLNSTTDNFRWAAAVAGAAQHARGVSQIGGWGYRDTVALGKGATGVDAKGYRREFLRLMEMAQGMEPQTLSRYSVD